MPKCKSGSLSGGSSEGSTNQVRQQLELTSEQVSPLPPMLEMTSSSSAERRRVEEGIGSIAHAEVSHSGTPSHLQIALEVFGHQSSGVVGSENLTGPDKLPSQGRAMPSGEGSLIKDMRTNSKVPRSLDFNSKGGMQAVVQGSPSIVQTGRLKYKCKGRLVMILLFLYPALIRGRWESIVEVKLCLLKCNQELELLLIEKK